VSEYVYDSWSITKKIGGVIIWVVLGFHEGLMGQGWNDVEVLARQVVNPTIDVNSRVTMMDEMISLLYDIDAGPSIVYVDARATGAMNGTTWEDGFHSIQAGINALIGKGGWVWVAEGSYRESIVLKKGVLLMGGFRGFEEDPGDRYVYGHRTNLVGDGINSVVFMEHRTVIDGFLITNGGGGSADGGAGIFTGDWLAIIRDNIIRENHAGWSGGGIFVNGGNAPGSPGDEENYSPIILGNLITRNSSSCGDGVCTRHSTTMMAHNTIVNHPSRGIEVVGDLGDVPTIVNCILWNNGDDLYNHVDWTGSAVFEYNCIEDWDAGEGVIYNNPLFADTTRGDFTLLPESPCIDAGLDGDLKDPDGSRADMGAYPFYHHRLDNGVDMTVDTRPVSGMDVMLDGKPYVTPVMPRLLSGSVHTLRAPLYQMGNPGSRYRFHEWSEGGDRVKTVTVPPFPTVHTAVYRHQYFLDIDSGGKGGNPEGRGWYFLGTHVVISVDSMVVYSPGKSRYIFKSWSGLGAGSYSGDLRQAVVAVYEPIIERVDWRLEYRLDVENDYDRSDDAGWYTSGADVTIFVNPIIEVEDDVWYTFRSWMGTGAGSYTGPNNPAHVRLDGPITEWATWATQYGLRVSVFPSDVPDVTVHVTPDAYWHDSGAEVQLEAIVVDTQYTFIGWSGDVTGTVNPLSLEIDRPTHVVANFVESNSPPQILTLPDTTMMEDGVLALSFDWLRAYVSDPDDPLDDLVWQFTAGENLSIQIDSTDRQIWILPASDWNGVEALTVRVSDPGGLSDTDTLTVNVSPVNDPPGSFGLLSPAHGSSIQSSGDILFTWKGSKNVDPGDSIAYSLHIGPEPSLLGPNTVVISGITDTTRLLDVPSDGSYWWGVIAEDNAGEETWCDQVFSFFINTGVEGMHTGLPTDYGLSQNSPNPFNPTTTIPYRLPNRNRVVLQVMDLQGRLVRTLVDDYIPAGHHSAVWDGRDDGGRIVPSGLYIYRIQFHDRSYARKFLLLK